MGALSSNSSILMVPIEVSITTTGFLARAGVAARARTVRLAKSMRCMELPFPVGRMIRLPSTTWLDRETESGCQTVLGRNLIVRFGLLAGKGRGEEVIT